MEQRVTRLETNMEHMAHSIDELSKQVTELNESLARYKGAWGMLVMVGGALVGAVTIWLRLKRG